MYRLACKSPEIESACRRPSCVFPGICPNLNTDHSALIKLYRRARELPGVKKVLIASGVRYDLASESPEYVRELAQHHVGGYLKIAPEHVARGSAVEDDEARHRHLRPLQGAVRQVLEGGGQGAVSHSVLHRRASRHDRRGHARARAVAEEERLPRRPGAGVPAVADGDRDGDVSHRQEPAAARDAHERRGARCRRACACAGCTRRSCATTTRTTGRCCARRCGAWGAPSSSDQAAISSSRRGSRLARAWHAKDNAPRRRAARRRVRNRRAPQPSRTPPARTQPMRTQHTGLPRTPPAPRGRKRAR